MHPDATTSVRAVGPVLAALSQAGVSLTDFANRVGINAEALANPEGRLPVSIVEPCWELAAEELDDPNVGLHIAQGVNRDSYDIFSYIASASTTLEEAITRVQRYFRLVADAAAWDLNKTGDQLWWTFQTARGNKPIRHDAEYGLAVSCTYARAWVGDAFQPNEVYFRHTAPDDTVELEAFFRAPLRFETDRCAYRCDASWLQAPLKTADSKLAGLLERYAEEALAALPDLGGYAHRVREQIANGLANGETSLQGIAKRLAVSERSLQRHLKDEGTSQKRLLEEVRRELAVRYLTDRKLTASEVSYMLGYSETAPFFRAFKKWTGKTPGDYRAA